MGGFLDLAASLLQNLASTFGQGGAGVGAAPPPDPLGSIFGALGDARGADPLSAIFGGSSTAGADPLSAIFGGSRGSSGGGADPFSALAGIVATQTKPFRQYQESKAEMEKAAKAPAPNTAPANVNAFAPDQQALAQQIIQTAVSQYGPAAGPVVAAILQAEGGLGGGVGDNTPGRPGYAPGGSHGPFQFHPGGQLANYATALGVDPATAGQMARSDPLAAAQWALGPQGYLGSALQQGAARGLTEDRLLQQVLTVQNPGALAAGSPEYARYQQALRQQMTPPAPMAPSPASGGYVFPVQGYQGQISLHHGSVRGGSDIMAPEGTPVVAMQGGTVTAAGTGGLGGNWVQIQGDDGNAYYYAHFRDAPLVRGGRVETGTPLGFVGRTGNAANTPPHLHIGIGPNIIPGGGPTGGTGGEYDALRLLQQALGQ